MIRRSPDLPLLMRLPFFYGWVIVGVAFVTMAVGVNARTAFSLLLPPILDEFGWERGVTAGAFSFGFMVSACLTPALGHLMDRRGPRLVIEGGVVAMGAGLMLAALVLVLLVPLNLLLKGQPQECGLEPDGDRAAHSTDTVERPTNVIDAAWVAVDWTLKRALKTARFWWLAIGYFCGLFAWYAVQVHQTKYLVEIGFSPTVAAWALGWVSLAAVPGQIALGHLSDRIGREWVWTIGNLGFVLCFAALLMLPRFPSLALLGFMVAAQGMLGYGLSSVVGAIPAEIFQGRHYGAIFGSIMLASIMGGAAGPWITGVIFDATGSYAPAFWIAIGATALSSLAIWLAAPGKVRAVAGQMR